MQDLVKLGHAKSDGAGNVMPTMPDGVYLTAYELWKAGRERELGDVCRWLSETAPSALAHPPHLANALERFEHQKAST